MKHYRGLIIFYSAMILLFVLVQVWHAQSAPEEKKQERERQLEGAALIMNAESPKMLDESTRLDSVTYNDGIMRISYTLIKVSKNEVDSDTFIKDTKALAASVSCTEKGLGPYVKSGLLIHYAFNDSSNSPVADFQIGSSDCL
ncbi:hypothetical protein NYP20_16295 [Pseudomonas sp. N3-W]|uniref:hypothetical protein n=1 Tax=Pseudomonas sp. N3-W TaxID=2975049 RepID=UPI00217DF006|nr:hypothetical protein [Pseudomonas sp. N3-W]UWF46910.1 hypothetical protein NYP20_16295 [Pseudomonas sp. N3-W]